MKLLERLTTHEKYADRESVYLRWYPKTLTPISGASMTSLEGVRPEGIYIHVPFCDRLCHFCPFNKRQTDNELLARYLQALHAEIDSWGEFSEDANIQFVYFGGGTPSVLTAQEISAILAAIRIHFGLAKAAEITLEAHPTHLTTDYAHSVLDAGITRISTGIQAFDDRLLSLMGAQHRAIDAFRAIENAADVFGQVSIDLLFRCPGQSLADWERQVVTAIELGCLSHISCYSLVLKDSRDQPPHMEEAAMTVLAHKLLSNAGYEHYASCASGGFDFALPGFQCRYELMHWGAPQAQFLGLGPGAFGFVGNGTTVNGLDLGRYCDRLTSSSLPLVSITPLNEEERLRRYFVLGVKTHNVPLGPFRASFGRDPMDVFRQEFKQLDSWGFALVEADLLSLSDLGRLFADSVSELFFSNKERDIRHPEEPEIRAIEIATWDAS